MFFGSRFPALVYIHVCLWCKSDSAKVVNLEKICIWKAPLVNICCSSKFYSGKYVEALEREVKKLKKELTDMRLNLTYKKVGL